MELLTSQFDRGRPKLLASSYLHVVAQREMNTRGTTYTRSTVLQSVSARAALCKQVVSLILSSTDSFPGRAQQGCE